ncbi:hypothetical protein [Streptomyces halobius]|uniref:Uncharacterized protein n=1 Tax=Streptomyces halobius TaxID=2879846 RepID=A0ABY4MD66_9ACTN|nr:hypothetical protein [Streptomyces halobius]UQA95720.1 hypothetical protein K9S39_31090 [Streptomyces halobius]
MPVRRRRGGHRGSAGGAVIGPAALAPLIEDVLRHLLDGDLGRAAVVLDDITCRGDAADVFGLCCAVADTGRAVLPVLYPHGYGPGLVVDVPADDAHRLFAARFLTAYDHGDVPMASALYAVAHTAGDRARTESVCALLALVSSFYRRAALSSQEGPRT